MSGTLVAPPCPLSDVETVLSIIHDCSSNTHNQQMMLLNFDQDQQEDNNNQNQNSNNNNNNNNNEQEDYTQLEVWQKARNLAVATLANFSSSCSSPSLSYSCLGPFDSNCLQHIETIAVCFAACKFLGTPGILFVNLEAMAVHFSQRFSPCCAPMNPNSSNNDENCSNNNTNSNNQQQEQPKQNHQGFKNLFSEDGEGGDNDENAIYRNNRNEDGDEINSETGEGLLRPPHDALLEAVVHAEKEIMKRCLFFSKVDF